MRSLTGDLNSNETFQGLGVGVFREKGGLKNENVTFSSSMNLKSGKVLTSPQLHDQGCAWNGHPVSTASALVAKTVTYTFYKGRHSPKTALLLLLSRLQE